MFIIVSLIIHIFGVLRSVLSGDSFQKYRCGAPTKMFHQLC
jgi:hypothetical protein